MLIKLNGVRFGQILVKKFGKRLGYILGEMLGLGESLL